MWVGVWGGYGVRGLVGVRRRVFGGGLFGVRTYIRYHKKWSERGGVLGEMVGRCLVYARVRFAGAVAGVGGGSPLCGALLRSSMRPAFPCFEHAPAQRTCVACAVTWERVVMGHFLGGLRTGKGFRVRTQLDLSSDN